MSKHVCLYLILLLFAVSLTLQYFRIRMRKQIIEMTKPFVAGKEFEHDWNRAAAGLRAVLRDFNRMRLLRKFARLLPDHVSARLQKFKILSTIELTMTISALLAAAFAYRICS